MAEILQSTKSTLVLLHGWGLNRAAWQSILPLLPADQPVLCLDLPGFGDHQQAPEPFALEAIAEQLLADIPDQSLVVGWSLGGLVAQKIAKIAPHKVRALALVASSPCFVAKADWPGILPTVLTLFANSLQDDVAKTIERFLAIQAMGSEHARQDIKGLKDAVLSLPLPQASALAGGLTILATEDLRDDLAQLRCPVSACFGRLDALVPIAAMSSIAEIAPAVDITVFAKASHAPFISHPDEFMQWLRSWLIRFTEKA
jgi:pimeloyl-[acyl-carrier protein] methyl ester esterase